MLGIKIMPWKIVVGQMSIVYVSSIDYNKESDVLPPLIKFKRVVPRKLPIRTKLLDC